MSCVGDAYDNAMCESFFATLECELLDRHRFRTQANTRIAAFDFIEGWYNPRRRHPSLDYRPSTARNRRLHSGLGIVDRLRGCGLSIPRGGGAVTISKALHL